MKAPPEDVRLSREDGEALIARLQADTLTGDDRRLLVKLIRIYFWFTFALSETKISLKRLKRTLFGGGKPPPPSPPPGGGAPGGAASHGAETRAAGAIPLPGTLPERIAIAADRQRGHGHQGA